MRVLSITSKCLLDFSILLILISGCAPTKGYSGPELPPEQLSEVHYRTDSNVIEVNNIDLDGVTFGFSGIYVLPGEHRFYLTITSKEPPDHCYAFPKIDYYALGRCREKAEKSCDCYDYLEVYQRCFRPVRDGNCGGSITTKAGSKYILQLRKLGEQTNVDIFEQGRGMALSETQCFLGALRTVTEESYEGSGQSTAYRHGIYSCY